ncbi:MAG: DNA-processing protein DprA [bacterium]|nr:DNA-processing protein DprA [bacterium]
MMKLNYWLLLHSIPGIGAATFNKLLERFGEPNRIIQAKREELMCIPRLSPRLVNSILSIRRGGVTPPLHYIQDMDKILVELNKRQFKMITRYNEDYPSRLRGIKNSPPIIYVYGKLDMPKTIAIVGTRQASFQGLQKAIEFASKLATRGFTIVSGYAKGIDTYAHLGALKGKGRTVMVLPTGVLNFALHKELYGVRAELWEHGTIVSEFFPTAGWTTGQAMLRNRIISGLGDATLVIEAGEKGGTIATAKWAKEQGKPLFISSPADNKSSKEIIGLGAKLVESPEDVLRELTSFSVSF